MNHSSPYNGSLTREQFLFHEMRIAAKLLDEGLSESEVVEEIVNDNLFQFPTERMVKNLACVCVRRLKQLEDDSMVRAVALQPFDVVQYILSVLSPTLGFESGYLKKIPVRVDESQKSHIESLTREAIQIARDDWDSVETSWDFKEHPFITAARTLSSNGESITIKQAFEYWKNVVNNRIRKMKEIEEELNRVFIEIYDLTDELSPYVDDANLTIRKADLQRDIRGFRRCGKSTCC